MYYIPFQTPTIVICTFMVKSHQHPGLLAFIKSVLQIIHFVLPFLSNNIINKHQIVGPVTHSTLEFPYTRTFLTRLHNKKVLKKQKVYCTYPSTIIFPCVIRTPHIYCISIFILSVVGGGANISVVKICNFRISQSYAFNFKCGLSYNHCKSVVNSQLGLK